MRGGARTADGRSLLGASVRLGAFDAYTVECAGDTAARAMLLRLTIAKRWSRYRRAPESQVLSRG